MLFRSLLHQTIDDQERIWRVGRRGKHLWKSPFAQSHETIDVLRTHQVGRELDDVIEVAADAFEHGIKVVEHLLELSFEIPDPGDTAVRSDGQLASDKEERPVADLTDMRIEALRRASDIIGSYGSFR